MGLVFEIGIWEWEIDFFDPSVAVADIVAFALEFEATGEVGDSFASLVAAIDAGIGATVDLVDGDIGVDFLAVKKHRNEGFFDEDAVFEASGAEIDIVGVPLSRAGVSVVRGRGFVDDSGHAVFGFVAIEDLDFEAILQIDAAIAAGFHDKEFDMEAEIAIGFFGDDIGGAIFAAGGDGVIGHEDRALVDGIFDDFPFDGERGFEAWALPINPFFVEERAGAIEDDFGAFEGFGVETDIGVGEWGERREEESGDEERRENLHDEGW